MFRALPLIAVAIVVLVAAFLWGRVHTLETTNKSLTEQVAALSSVAESQEKAIEELQKARRADAVILSKLRTEYTNLLKINSEMRKQVSTAEVKNANVTEYLNTVVPYELACVLNRTCEQSSGGTDSKTETAQ